MLDGLTARFRELRASEIAAEAVGPASPEIVADDAMQDAFIARLRQF